MQQHQDEEAARGYKTLQWRTAPVRIPVDGESELVELGLRDIADEDQADIDTATVNATAGLFDAYTTPEERARTADIAGELSDPEKQTAELLQEVDALHSAALDRAAAAGDLRHATYLAGGRLEQLIEQLWEADVAAYETAYLATIRTLLTARGLPADVEILSTSDADAGGCDDELAWGLRAEVLSATPLPVVDLIPGKSVTKYTTDELRDAGLTYLDRARALLHTEPAPSTASLRSTPTDRASR